MDTSVSYENWLHFTKQKYIFLKVFFIVFTSKKRVDRNNHHPPHQNWTNSTPIKTKVKMSLSLCTVPFLSLYVFVCLSVSLCLRLSLSLYFLKMGVQYCKIYRVFITIAMEKQKLAMSLFSHFLSFSLFLFLLLLSLSFFSIFFLATLSFILPYLR